jgi:HK97 family phage major capsid protein
VSKVDLELKTALDSIGGTVQAFKAQQDLMQKQLDAVDVSLKERHAGAATPDFVSKLQANEQFLRLMHDRKGSAIIKLEGKDALDLLQRKATITASGQGFATTGVMAIDRIPGITPEARQQLTVRNVLTANPTNLAVVDFVRVSTPMTKASPQTEASDKAENAVTFTSHSERIRTLATWIPATKQVLDDFGELANFISNSLVYYVNLEEELQLLSGSGSGEDLDGLITQASAFDTSLLSNTAGWNKIDIIGRAVQQITEAKEIQPSFAIINPRDWWGMRLQKDGFGRFLLGSPQTDVSPSLFNLTILPTTNIAAGTFLVGSGNPTAAEIRDRMELIVEVSTQHADYFVKNLVAIRGEKRLCLVVKRPASFVTGSFTQSPA